MSNRSKTITFNKKPSILSFASVVGPKESDGPYGRCFDICGSDSLFGEASYEKTESKLQKLAVEKALKRSAVNFADIDCVFADFTVLVLQCCSHL